MHLLLLAALVTSIPQIIPQAQTSAPNRQPELTSVPGLTALVFGSGNSIWMAASRNNGQSFSKASEVAQVPVLALGRHRGPRVVISGKTILVSAVYGETAAGPHAHGLPANGDLVTWRSTDEGRSWSKPIVINDVPGAAREGLHAMTAGADGEIAAVWLDLRATGTRLFGAYSKDGGSTWSKNVPIYISPEATICQCCDPSLTSSGKNGFDIMFRNVAQGARDMYVTNWNLDGQITKPQKLGAGSWKLDGCPMDGGGLVHTGKSVITAWRRDQTVYLDETGHSEIALGQGKDVAIALSGKGPYVAWTGSCGIEIHGPAAKESSCVSSAGSFPTLSSLPNGSVIAAWEQEGQIHLRSFE